MVENRFLIDFSVEMQAVLYDCNFFTSRTKHLH